MKARPKRPAKPATIPLPETWKDAFKSSTMRTNFMLTLTQPMIEFLSAVSDGVHWDRSQFRGNIHAPDNWWASSRALEKRGLVQFVKLTDEENTAHMKTILRGTHEEWCESAPYWKLTPAGDAMVQLLKVTGIFIEADAAIRKKARKA